MSKLNKDKFVSAIYSATLSPNSYDETLNKINDFIFVGDQHKIQKSLVYLNDVKDYKNACTKHIADSSLIPHLQTANDIQLRLGRQKVEKSNTLLLMEAAQNPVYIFDYNENIIAMNTQAQNIGHADNITLQECCVSEDILDKIRDFIAVDNEKKILVVPGYIYHSLNANTSILVEKLDREQAGGLQNYYEENKRLFLFTIVNLGFDKSKTKLFQDTYDLTPAEMDIAILIASGKQIPEIAVWRNASVATIRTQFKAIKKKTNSRDISAVVRLLCGFSAGIFKTPKVSFNKTSHNDNASSLPLKKQITLRDRRVMHYLEQGSSTGIPVLMIHNMPYGVELPKDAISAAKRMNLRIISPYRPGFGNSENIRKNMNLDKVLDEVAHDICELLDHLKIPKATIVGQSIGSVYALRFARLYANRTSHLFAISRAPIWHEKWTSDMPKRQRLIVHITKYLPQLLPIITHATVMYIDKGHARELIHTLCKDSAADLKALTKDPEIYELMARGCEEGLKQGVEAFNRDCKLSIQDFTDEARLLSHPFHILHGDSDEIVNISQSKEFVEQVPNTTLEVVEGAGHLLFYSHWDRVLKAIRNKHKYKRKQTVK